MSSAGPETVSLADGAEGTANRGDRPVADAQRLRLSSGGGAGLKLSIVSRVSR